MAKISLRTVQERTKAGIWNGSDTVSSKAKAPSHRAVGRSVEIIVDSIAEKGTLTRLEIARILGRKKTPHLIELIEHLVQIGVLIRHNEPMPNGKPCYFYALSDDMMG